MRKHDIRKLLFVTPCWIIALLLQTMSFRLAITPNVSACQSHHEESQINQINEVLFWTAAAVCTLIFTFGAIADGLVIYFANQEPSTGALRHLNKVVKQLAVSDILLGVLACPLTLAYWKMGKLNLVKV